MATVDDHFDSVISLLHFDTGFNAVIGPNHESGNGSLITTDDDPVWGNALSPDIDHTSNLRALHSIDPWPVVPTPDSFTLELTYTPDDLDATSGLWLWGPESSDLVTRWQLDVTTAGALRCYRESNSVAILSAFFSADGVIVPGTRYQLCLETYNGTAYLYVDGVIVASQAYTATPLIGNSQRIGYVFNASNQWHRGPIDEFRATNASRYQGAPYVPATEPFPNQAAVPKFRLALKKLSGWLEILPIKWGQVEGDITNQEDLNTIITDLQQEVDTLRQNMIDNFVVAGYGGINLSTPDVGFPDLGDGWETLPADNAYFTAPRAVTQDVATDSLSILYPGVWIILIAVAFHHNSSNSGRTTYLRLFDIDDGDAPGKEYPLGIGRNVEDTSESVTFPVVIDEADAGHAFRVEIGGGDDVTIASDGLTIYSFSVIHASEFYGSF